MNKYKDMSYIDFLEKVLKINLTEDQKISIELFEENKREKDNTLISPYPIDKPFQDPVRPPYISYTKNTKDINNVD